MLKISKRATYYNHSSNESFRQIIIIQNKMCFHNMNNSEQSAHQIAGERKRSRKYAKTHEPSCDRRHWVYGGGRRPHRCIQTDTSSRWRSSSRTPHSVRSSCDPGRFPALCCSSLVWDSCSKVTHHMECLKDTIKYDFHIAEPPPWTIIIQTNYLMIECVSASFSSTSEFKWKSWRGNTQVNISGCIGKPMTSLSICTVVLLVLNLLSCNY